MLNDKIEQLRADKTVLILLKAIRKVGAYGHIADKLVGDYMGKNPTINDKIKRFNDELVEHMDELFDDLYADIAEYVIDFIGEDKDDIFVYEVVDGILFDYGENRTDIDGIIDELKRRLVV